MSKIAIAFGLILVVLGVGAYVGTGQTSWTALIPAFFGLPIAICGIIAARNDKARMHAMHGAVLLGTLGLLGTVPGLTKFFIMLGGGTVERPTAVKVQAAMCVLCGIFVVLCVRSFIAARRART